MAKIITTENAFEQGDREIAADDLVTVIGTGNSKHLPQGSKHVVHRELAAKLIDNGSAKDGGKAPKKAKPPAGQTDL